MEKLLEELEYAKLHLGLIGPSPSTNRPQVWGFEVPGICAPMRVREIYADLDSVRERLEDLLNGLYEAMDVEPA